MNDFDDDRPDDRPRRDRGDGTALARARTSGPGLILIILGIFGILSSLALVGFTHNLDAYREWLKSVEEKQPAGNQKDNIKRHIEQMEEADTPEGRTVNTLMYGGTAFVSFLIALGGWKMRSLGGYPLALAGSIFAIIPFNGCCCISTPFGIWGLVTLLNPDVRAGFRRNANREPRDGDDFDSSNRD